MNARRTGLIAGLIGGLAISLVFLVGFVAGAAFDRHQTSAEFDTSDPNLRDFLTAYHLVTSESYYRPFNKHQLVYAAIDGMLNATGDPHTVFLSPNQNKSANSQLNGSHFSGIGAIVLPDGSELRVLAAVPGSPASQAGLRPGDLLTRINGRSVARMSGDEAVALIHGPTGSRVRLTVIRGHAAPFTISVKRAQIAPITAYFNELPRHLGYIRILSFGETTPDEVKQALEAFRAAHDRGVIVDLRGNPGGYVEAAQSIVSFFLGHGVVAYEKRAGQAPNPLPVLTGNQIVSVPVAVLVDDGTASAAEITAAALRDEDHAPLIGIRTYGKGSMQSVYSLGDGSTVRITDRLWLTPHKQSIAGVGLRPTIRVAGGTGSITSDPQLAAAEHFLSQHAAR